jgi:hypothetical protein
MPGPAKILSPGRGIDEGFNRAFPVKSGDSRACAFAGVNAYRKGRRMYRRILRNHGRQIKFARPLLRDCLTQKAPSVRNHKVDSFGAYGSRGHHKVALVFAALIVGYDEHLSFSQFFYGFFN